MGEVDQSPFSFLICSCSFAIVASLFCKLQKMSLDNKVKWQENFVNLRDRPFILEARGVGQFWCAWILFFIVFFSKNNYNYIYSSLGVWCVEFSFLSFLFNLQEFILLISQSTHPPQKWNGLSLIIYWLLIVRHKNSTSSYMYVVLQSAVQLSNSGLLRTN